MKRNRQYAWRIDWVCGLAYIYGTNAQTTVEAGGEWEKIYNSGNVLLNGDIIGKNIVIVDDLYQSGVTMWQYARYLKSQGANQVWGLVCVKSLRDSDNT